MGADRDSGAMLQEFRDAAQEGWDDVEAGRYAEVTNEAERKVLWDEIDREAAARRAARVARQKLSGSAGPLCAAVGEGEAGGG